MNRRGWMYRSYPIHPTTHHSLPLLLFYSEFIEPVSPPIEWNTVIEINIQVDVRQPQSANDSPVSVLSKYKKRWRGAPKNMKKRIEQYVQKTRVHSFRKEAVEYCCSRSRLIQLLRYFMQKELPPIRY